MAESNDAPAAPAAAQPQPAPQPVAPAAAEPLFSISLPQSAWDYILRVLQERPMREVSGLVGQILNQANQQVQANAIAAARASGKPATPRKPSRDRRRR